MIKNGYVNVKSLQDYGDGEREQISFLSEAQLERENGAISITYDESECTGFEDTKTKLTVTDESFQLSRSGKYEMSLYFNRKNKWDGLYQTPYGVFHVETKLKENQFNFEAEDFKMRCHYEVIFEKEEKINTQLQIVFSPQKWDGDLDK